jgi:hypothetical protein
MRCYEPQLETDEAFRQAELNAPSIDDPTVAARMPRFCDCRGPVSTEGRCVRCGHRAPLRCDACHHYASPGCEVTIEHLDGLALVCCERCRTLGRRPTSARVRRVASLTPLEAVA